VSNRGALLEGLVVDSAPRDPKNRAFGVFRKMWRASAGLYVLNVDWTSSSEYALLMTGLDMKVKVKVCNAVEVCVPTCTWSISAPSMLTHHTT